MIEGTPPEDDGGETSNVENVGMEGDMPPLSSYLSGCMFWWKFAVWPIVFLLFNGIVFATLVVFDEYEYRNRNHRTYDDGDGATTGGNSYLDMLKYNEMVGTIMLLLDTFVLYQAVVFLEKEIRALDLTEDVEVEASYHANHVHAQVSRKMDAFLSRGPRPRVSIFVSLLLLAALGCAATGLSCLAAWCFTLTQKAEKVCLSPFGDMNGVSRKNEKTVDGLPDDLQKWAKSWRERSYQDAGGGLIHLNDGTTYFGAKVPPNTSEYSTSGTNTDDVSDSFGQDSSRTQNMVSIGTNGSVRFFPNVVFPRLFSSVKGIGELNSECFCCVYDAPKGGNDMSVLCVKSSEDVSAGVFRNVTIARRNNEAINNGVIGLMSASITPYAEELWLELVRYRNDYRRYTHRYTMEYYKIKPDTLQLNSIVNVTDFMNEESFGMFVEEQSACSFWLRVIDRAMIMSVLWPACFWLLKVRSLPAGVVPACAAGFTIIACINADLALGLAFMAICVATLALLGLIPTSLGREEMVWGLYTTLASVVVLGRTDKPIQVILHVLPCVIVGIVLNHPVLYLMGWIGGILAVLCGSFFLFVGKHEKGIILICMGIIGGPGFVTVGFNLTKYRAYILYHLKRAWRAMNTAVTRSKAPSNDRSAARPRPSSPVYGNDSDLTTGLLNLNS